MCCSRPLTERINWDGETRGLALMKNWLASPVVIRCLTTLTPSGSVVCCKRGNQLSSGIGGWRQKSVRPQLS